MDSTPVARYRAEYQHPKYRRRHRPEVETNCGIDCPPLLRRRIDSDCASLALLLAKGLYTEATRMFIHLREHALQEHSQPNTLDPYDVPIGDTQIGGPTAQVLSRLGIMNVGQVAHVPISELRNHGLRDKDLEHLESQVRIYGVRLRGR